jgi:hypothetical protein
MLVAMKQQPSGSVDGISLDSFRVGCTYEINPLLAQYLVLEGYAFIEMRRLQRSSEPRRNDRRHGGRSPAPA